MQESDKASQTDTVRCLDLVHQPLHQPLSTIIVVSNYDQTASGQLKAAMLFNYLLVVVTRR